jgi:beta-lactam-binding protein with PASTA domain
VNGTRLICLLGLASALAFAAGCAQAKPQRVPEVRGDRLDLAEATLEARGLSYEVHGGGKLGVIDDSDWLVCEQAPAAGLKATMVELAVARSCSRALGTPDLVGLSLHDAREALEARRIDLEVYSAGEYYGDEDDDDVIVVERNWQVCEQFDRSSDGGRYVQLIVAHDC